MIFRRTALGLSNLHRFARADLIVFTEGGARTLAKGDALGGKNQKSGMDAYFWRELFKRARPEVKISIRSVGSKTTLLDIARDIVGRKTDRVCVAMDRDYDAHMGRLIRARNVIYTWGYSWENELLRGNVIEEVFYDLTHVDRTVLNVRRTVREIIATARKDLRWLTYADALLCLGGSGLFDRKKAESAIGDGNSLPTVKKEWLRGELRKRRLSMGKFRLVGGAISVDPIRDSFGKVVGVLAYRILSYLLKKHSAGPNLAKPYAYIFLTKGVCEWLAASRGSTVSKYYFRQIARVLV